MCKEHVSIYKGKGRERKPGSSLALGSLWGSRGPGCSAMAPSRASVPPLLAGGRPNCSGGVEGVLFCSDPLVCPEMESGRKVRGVRVRASLRLPSSAFSEDGGSGGPGGGGPADGEGGAGLGRWLTLRVAAGLLGADGVGTGASSPPSLIPLLLPSALLSACPSWSSGAPPPAPGPRLPLPPLLQFRECPASPHHPQLLRGESVSHPEPHSLPP